MEPYQLNQVKYLFSGNLSGKKSTGQRLRCSGGVLSLRTLSPMSLGTK